MSVDCKHWQACDHPMGGCCGIGRSNRPSLGVCSVCDRREPREQAPVTPTISAKISQVAGSVIGGVMGLAKAAAGVDQVDDQVRQARLAICDGCEHSLPKTEPVEQRRCGQLLDAIRPETAPCGCGLRKKTSLGGQACPLGKWEAIDGSSKAD